MNEKEGRHESGWHRIIRRRFTHRDLAAEAVNRAFDEEIARVAAETAKIQEQLKQGQVDTDGQD